MPNHSLLRIELLSDTTFSRGEGTAGAVDAEVEHDEFGIPFIGGKTVRGLLRDSWLSMCAHFTELATAAERVLGRSQSLDDSCKLRIGDARVSLAIRSTIRRALDDHRLSPALVLAAFTAIRYQTSEDRKTGAPKTGTLRSSRVVMRSFKFESPLTWLDGYQPEPADLQVLALSALAARHGGLCRNRGRGYLRLTLDGDVDETRRMAACK